MVCPHAHSRHPARRRQGTRALHPAAHRRGARARRPHRRPRRARARRSRRRDRAAGRRRIPSTDTVAVDATRAVLARGAASAGCRRSASASAPSCWPRRRAARTHPCAPEWGYREVALAAAAATTSCSASCRRGSRSSRRTRTASSCRRARSRSRVRPATCRRSASATNAWGIQFHPEPTLEMLDGWTHALGHLMQAEGVDPAETRDAGAALRAGLDGARGGDGAALRRRRRARARRRRRRDARAGRSPRRRRAAGAGA